LNNFFTTVDSRNAILTKLKGNHSNRNDLRSVGFGRGNSYQKKKQGYWLRMLWQCKKKKNLIPISGPAFKWIPQSVLRAMALPTVFVIPTHKAPRFLQYSNASNVSAVSPDCDTKKHVSSLKIGVDLSKKSEANSMQTGKVVNSSTI